MTGLIRNIATLIFLFCFIHPVVFAQNEFSSEEELREKAEEYLVNEKFAKAMPLYGQLLSLYPKDPMYNYLFGICVLYGDRREPEKSFKYLEFAREHLKGEANINYYLGQAYHYNYQFREAILAYTDFVNTAPERDVRRLNVRRKIEMCVHGLELLQRISELYVLEKANVKEEDFYRFYHIDDFGGKLLSKPYTLQSGLDKRRDASNFVFFSDTNNLIYFSSYGSKRKTGKDIFFSVKLEDGSWSEPELFSDVINTSLDEDYPFMMPDGKTFYFSSKGHNSMGGYDIFVSRFDTVQKVWQPPENMDFAINTPHDDFMFVADTALNYAYFSSTRNSVGGNVNVYKVRIDQRPLVKTGIYLADKNTPVTREQDSLYKANIKYLLEKSDLEVNADKDQFREEKTEKNIPIAKVDSEKRLEEIYSEKKRGDVLTDTAFAIANQLKRQVKWEEDKLTNANKIINSRKAQLKEKNAEVKEAYKNAEKLPSSAKEVAMRKAKALEDEYKVMESEVKIAEDLKIRINQHYRNRRETYDMVNSYAGQIQKMSKTNKLDKAEELFDEMHDILQRADTLGDYAKIAFENHQQYISEVETEAIRNYSKATQQKREAEDLRTDARDFRQDAAGTNDENIRNDMLEQASVAENDANKKEAEADRKMQLGKKYQAASDSAIKATNILDKMISYIDYYDEMLEIDEKEMELMNGKEKEETGKKPIDKEVIQEIEQTLNTQLDVLAKDSAYNSRQSERMLAFAANKLDLSEALDIEAEKLHESGTEANDKKSAELYEESLKLKREAVAAYQIHKEYLKRTEKKSKSLSLAKGKASVINTKLREGDEKTANNLIDEFNVVIVNQQNEYPVAKNLTNRLTQKRDSLAEEEKAILAEANDLLNDAKSLRKKSITQKEKAENTNRKKKKEDLLQQSGELEQQAQQKEAEANVLFDKNLDNQQVLEATSTLIDFIGSANEQFSNTPSNVSALRFKKDFNLQDFVKTISKQLQLNIFSNSYADEDEKVAVAEMPVKELPVDSMTSGTEEVVFENSVKEEQVDTPMKRKNEDEQKLKTDNQWNEDSYQLILADDAYSRTRIIDNTLELILAQANMYRQRMQNAGEDESKNHQEHIDSLMIVKRRLEMEKENIVSLSGNQNKSLKAGQEKDIDEYVGKLEDDAAIGFKNVNDMRKQAYMMPEGTAKEELLTEADSLESNAMAKQKAAYSMGSLQNMNRFYTNDIALNIEKERYANRNEDAFGEATTKTYTARWHLTRASSYSDSAAQAQHYAALIRYLENARREEKKALELQQEALEFYRKESGIVLAEEPKVTSELIQETKSMTRDPDVREDKNIIPGSSPEVFYRIQIAASRIPLNFAAYNINKDIVTEDISGSDMVRYMVGMYEQLTEALENRKEIRSKGLSDAFVVAYHQGKRIQVGEARRLQNTGAVSQVITDKSALGTLLNTDESRKILPVGKVEGFFYSVQVGVFSRKRSAADLKYLYPLFEDILTNGNYRYYAGIFQKSHEAIKARNEIRNLGLKDAFVVPVRNGKRISLAQAGELERTNAPKADAQGFEIFIMPSEKETSKEEINAADIVFKIQIGAYSKEVPVEVVDLMISVSELGLEKYMREDGLTIYTIGKFSDYEEAGKWRLKIHEKGIPDAFIVAYANNVKISVSQALEIIKRN